MSIDKKIKKRNINIDLAKWPSHDIVLQRYYLVTSETCYTETLLGHIWHAHIFIIVE